MKFKLAAAVAIGTLTTLAFQNCQRFGGNGQVARDVASNAVGPVRAQSVVQAAGSFANGYQSPASPQGTFESRLSTLDARYKKLRSIGTGYRQYNLSWREVEDMPSVPSRATPFACPAGHTLVPATEAERVAAGFHRFRCVNDARMAVMDELLRLDQANGMQSGGVIYFIPDQYRYPGCEGFNFAGNVITGGCVPRDDAMDDFEDYVNLLASRYNGGARGKLSHFIIWNENASTDWNDYTPIVGRTDYSPAATARRLDKMADLMKRAHAALARHQKAAMLYVSTDPLWLPGSPNHIGTRTLLQGLWDRLGTQYAWSVAVHPYGHVEEPAAPNVYTFNNLEIVSNFQMQQLQARGVANPAVAPQHFLIASEQGWPTAESGREGQARQMCLAHEKVMTMSNVVAVAHNYFQSVEPQEASGGTSVQGAFYGLIPYGVPDSLAGMENTSTGQAYISTSNPSLWRATSNHYCCRAYGLGCPGESFHLSAPSVAERVVVLGNVDGVTGNTITGWACTRTMEAPISVHLYANGPAGGGGTGVGAFDANVASEPAVAAACATSGEKGYRFRITLNDAQLASFGGSTIYVHGISSVGGANNLLAQSGNFRIPYPAGPAGTTAVYRFAHPTNGDHFFTLNEAEGRNAGYRPEGVGFRVLPNQVAGTSAIYRCFGSNLHFVSRAPGCEGTTVEGVYGYVYDTPGAGRAQLYRVYRSSDGDHIATLNASEGAPAYANETTLGYVLPP